MNPPANHRQPPAQASMSIGTTMRRFAPAAVILAMIALAYGLGLHREISFETLIRHRTAIDAFIAGNIVAAISIYIALYVAVVSLSLPGAGIMTVTGGLLFGPVLGTAAAIVGACVGAVIVFLIARTAIGEFLLRRAGPFAARFAEGFRANAFSYLLFLRLVPFPFFVINLVPALFGIRLSTFIAATFIGILPATAIVAVFGAGLGTVIDAQTAQFNACLHAGRSDCSVSLGLSDVLTPTLIFSLAGLGLLAVIPPLARRIFRFKTGSEPISKTASE